MHDFIDADIRLRINPDENRVERKVSQDLPSSFLDRLKDTRTRSANKRMGEFHHVASIPVALVEKWQAEGFNLYDKNVSVQDVLKRLNSEDLTAFIATSRKI
jgi:hypothetical protein